MQFIPQCNEFLMNIINDINTMLCPIKNNSNTIELTVPTSCYWVLDLLCVTNNKTVRLKMHNDQ